MKTNAFTMIELIFVIVILGILAAVAIPKLSATRDDAKASAIASSVMAGMEEIASYAMSKGVTDNSLAIMSNSFTMLEASGDANLTSNKAIVKGGSITDCMTVDINTTATEEVLQMSLGNAGTDSICTSIQQMIHAENYPMQLRGTSVVH
jgi:general secretion pathway protein G